MDLNANLSPEEVAFVVELGLNLLLARGVMPTSKAELVVDQQTGIQ